MKKLKMQQDNYFLQIEEGNDKDFYGIRKQKIKEGDIVALMVIKRKDNITQFDLVKIKISK